MLLVDEMDAVELMELLDGDDELLDEILECGGECANCLGHCCTQDPRYSEELPQVLRGGLVCG